MQFIQGADVYTSNDHPVGQIDRVVIDPKTQQVTHIVVQKGFLFTEDKVVPIDLVAEANEDRVTLREHAGNLQALPDFEETHYVMADENRIAQTQSPPYAAPPLYWYPAFGAPTFGYAGGYPAPPPYVMETEQNIPEDTVALKDGAEVISADGEQVGKVERVLIDETSDRATHFLISAGLLFKQKRLVPTSWVDSLAEDQVHLAVSTRILEALPEYHD